MLEIIVDFMRAYKYTGDTTLQYTCAAARERLARLCENVHEFYSVCRPLMKLLKKILYTNTQYEKRGKWTLLILYYYIVIM